jgi:uncharacterized protein (DUF427 family)
MLNYLKRVNMTCINISMSKLSGFVKTKCCPWNGEAAMYALNTKREIPWNAKMTEEYLK